MPDADRSPTPWSVTDVAFGLATLRDATGNVLVLQLREPVALAVVQYVNGYADLVAACKEELAWPRVKPIEIRRTLTKLGEFTDDDTEPT